MSAETPTRLELHKLRYHRDGKTGSLLRHDQLEEREKKLIARDFMERLNARSGKIDTEMYLVYLEALEDWGVMCPHPDHYRRYSGIHRSKETRPEDHRWYQCLCCGCGVFNEKKSRLFAKSQ